LCTQLVNGRPHPSASANSSHHDAGRGRPDGEIQFLKLDEEIKKFAWQEGYGGFSVSKSKIPVVVRYIRNQERHHKKMSFEDEFRALLEKHGIEFDPKYIFG
jgi:hypothetical protein